MLEKELPAERNTEDTRISESAVEKLALLFGTQNIAPPSNTISTRSGGTEGIDTSSIFKPKEIESITPIEFIDEGSLSGESLVAEKSTLYAVNYKDDEGYLIVDTNQDKFPIVSFNNKGSFRFNELDSAQKISFQKEYTGYIAESNGEQLNVWCDILDCLNNPELNDDGIPLN